MTAEHDERRVATVLDGGQDGTGSPTSWRGNSAGQNAAPRIRGIAPSGRQGSAAAQDSGDAPVSAPDAAADSWPAWARPQLHAAVSLAEDVRAARARGGASVLAAELYRGWYRPILGRVADLGRHWRPLAGTYRVAHAGSGARIRAEVADGAVGIETIDRRDAVGRDGWWRTWGEAWAPIDGRRNGVRVLLSPRPSALAEFVGAVTGALLGSPQPWLLACTTDPRRLNRSGAAVLHVPDLAALPPNLLAVLRPLLMPVAPPLCLPLEPGAALAESTDDGASFGVRRCRLVALALLRPSARNAPLTAIADVFGSHGIDPATPYRAAGR